MEKMAASSTANQRQRKRHQPLLNKLKIYKGHDKEKISHLETVVLSGADLEAVRDVYEMDPDALTMELFFDAHVYGVSKNKNGAAVLDFLCDNLHKGDDDHSCVAAFNSSRLWNNYDYRHFSSRYAFDSSDGDFIRDQGMHITSLVPALCKILGKPEMTKAHFSFTHEWVIETDNDADEGETDTEENTTSLFDSQIFFHILEVIFQNKNIRSLGLVIPHEFCSNSSQQFRLNDYDDPEIEFESPEQVAKSLSEMMARVNDPIRISSLLLHCHEDFTPKYLDLFLAEVVLNYFPELDSLEIRSMKISRNTLALLSNLLSMGRLKTFELRAMLEESPPETAVDPLLPMDILPMLLEYLMRPDATLTHVSLECDVSSATALLWLSQLRGFLKTTNTTLEHLSLGSDCSLYGKNSEDDLDFVDPELNFYLALNRVGRGRFRDSTVPLTELVGVIAAAEEKCASIQLKYPERYKDRQGASRKIPADVLLTSCLYELLKECPGKWATGIPAAPSANNNNNTSTRPSGGCTVKQGTRSPL